MSWYLAITLDWGDGIQLWVVVRRAILIVARLEEIKRDLMAGLRKADS